MEIDTLNFFTYSTLKKLFQATKEVADITPFCEGNGERKCFLRHDIDFDIKAAYKLSHIEKECKVRSTFFVMVTNQFYNPLSIMNREMLWEMSTNDFEIGLHFDPSIYGAISENAIKGIISKADREIKILESILPKKIESISIHRPLRYGKFIHFEGYNNTYFPPEVYLSDAHMVLDKDPFEFIKLAAETPIELSLHPFHYTEQGENYIKIFERFITDTIDRIDKDFELFSTYQALLNGKKLKDYL